MSYFTTIIPNNTAGIFDIIIFAIYLFYLFYLFIIYLKFTNLHNLCINYTIKIAKKKKKKKRNFKFNYPNLKIF